MVNPAKAGSPSLNLNKNEHFSKVSLFSRTGLIISRVRGFHLQGIQGYSRSRLLQTLDDAVNECLVHARRVKNFEKMKKKTFGTNCHVQNKSKIVNHKLSLLLIKRLLKNFHEIFRLCSDLPIPEYHKLGGGQFLNTHGTEGMEF